MTTLRPYKFLVKAIPQIVDDDGIVLSEHDGIQPVSVFGCEQLKAWADDFPTKLSDAQKSEGSL
jgi:hypothetical protein